LKISKASRWILTIGILAILLITLGVTYSRQKAEQSELTANIAQAHQTFTIYSKQTAEYTAEKNALEARLNEANSRITSAKDKFRHHTQSIEINGMLFEAANNATVTITKLSSSLPEDEELNGITYQVFTLGVEATGEVVALLNFSNKISERFSTATIESVEISVPRVEEGESEEMPTMKLRLKIYLYEGE